MGFILFQKYKDITYLHPKEYAIILLYKQKMRTSAYATTPDRIKVMKYLLVEKVSLS